MSEDNVGSKVSFFLVGLGIGALVGILFAPKSGEETREYLTSRHGTQPGDPARLGAALCRIVDLSAVRSRTANTTL